MLKNIEHISETRKVLLIEIPSEVIEQKIQAELKRAQKDIKMPGFRTGKVPLSMIERKYGKSIEADVLKHTISDYYEKAINKANIKPVSMPDIYGQFQFIRQQPLQIRIKVDVRPDVKDLKYDGIEIKDVPVTVTDEDVMNTIRQFARDRANYEASELPAEEADLVSFDCKSDSDEKKDVLLRVASSSPYPEEFSNAFLGKKAGDQFELEVDFTDKENLPLNGMKGKILITVNTVKKRKEPVLDDEFAKDLGLNDFNELFNNTKESITRSRNSLARNEKIKQIFDKLIETHDFELPESQVERELSSLINEAKANNKDLTDEEELKKSLLPIAQKNVKLINLLNIIGEKEKVEVSQKEVERELIELASRVGVTPEELLRYYLEKDGSLAQIYNNLYIKAVCDRLLEKAKVLDSSSEKEGTEEVV